MFSLRLILGFVLCASLPVCAARKSWAIDLQNQAAAAAPPFTQQQLETLLPATVYFRGKTASLQLRNAGGINFGGDAIVLAALVDTSGYSSAIQDAYQLYLLTETPLTIGGQRLPAGAYGAGIVSGKFTVLDIGNHPVLQAAAMQDASMTRPRPLQVLSDGPHAIKLYLGRHWVRMQEATQ